MKNTGWLVFEQIFRMGLNVIVTSLMVRYLGTHDFGLLTYSYAFTIIFTTVSNLGIDSIIVNEMIKNRDETGKVIGTTIYLRLIASFASIISIFFLIRLLNPDETFLYLITFIQSISIIFLALDSISYWFQSNLQSKYIVIAKSVAFIIVSIWRLALIYFEKSVYFFAVATIIEAVVMCIFVVGFYIYFKGPKLRFSYRIAKQLLTKAFYFFISGILILLFTEVDKIMLGQIVNNTSVGIYAAALTISSLWMFIPSALINSARPVIMTAKTQDLDSYTKKFKQLFCSIIWIGIVASCVITILSKPIILLIYGNQFQDSIAVLSILIWSRIFSLIGSIRAMWLTTEDLAAYQMHFVGMGAILNIGFNLLLIPKYGAIGAAIAALITEALSTFLLLLIFKKTRPLFKLIIEAFLFKGIKS